MVMESTPPVWKRGRRKASDIPVPLAFSFDADPVQPVHAVTVIGWSDAAREALRDLAERIVSRRPGSLPVESLRGRLEVADPDNLRLDRGLGLRGRGTSIMWTPLEPDEAVRRVGGAVLGWLTDGVTVREAADREVVQSLRRLARGNGLVGAARRKAPVFAWESTRTGTAGPISNRHAYEDLADFTARRLEGQEVLAGCGGLRRIASGRLDLNEAELMTEPLLGRSSAFSIVVRVVVYSYVGRATPVVVLRFSRRTWVRSLPGAAAATLTAFALPEGTSTALTFTLRRRRASRAGLTVYSYEPDDDFAPIARAYGLLLSSSGDEIVGSGHLDAGCRLLVPHKHGVGPPADARPGVPDLDKMMAFRRAAEVLAPTGLRPWTGLAAVPSDTRAQQDRDQGWRHRDGDEAHREAFARWRETTMADIVACYAGVHSVVVGHHASCHPDAVKVGGLLREMLGDHVRLQPVRIPDDVHGARSALPAPAVDKRGNRDYAELRAQAWKPFISEVGRFRQESGRPLDGILVLAPEWYGNGMAHDDRVNKRAGRITLARELRVPVQYLRPERELAGFETRLMMAWRDLAWRNVGRIRAERLAEAAERVYGGAGLLPPDRVLGVGVLRRNKTRLANETSFVPYALELDLRAGTCSARFAREHGPALEILPSMPLAEALVELASSGPVKLAVSKAGRLEQLQERTQRFLHEVITEFCQRAERPLVLIDGPACRQVWPWAADARLDSANILIAGHPHAEADWGDVRIVRVRTDNAPKVLFDGRFEGPWGPNGELVGYDAPKWSEAQLLKVTDGVADVYLSFGSLLRTGRVLGTSCYRDVEGLEKLPGKPPRYVRGSLRHRLDAWNTPSGVEFTVVRTAHGESPNQLARLVEQLRTVFVHIGDWSMKPAPLHFEGALKEYLADYQLDEDDADDDGA